MSYDWSRPVMITIFSCSADLNYNWSISFMALPSAAATVASLGLTHPYLKALSRESQHDSAYWYASLCLLNEVMCSSSVTVVTDCRGKGQDWLCETALCLMDVRGCFVRQRSGCGVTPTTLLRCGAVISDPNMT